MSGHSDFDTHWKTLKREKRKAYLSKVFFAQGKKMRRYNTNRKQSEIDFDSLGRDKDRAKDNAQETAWLQDSLYDRRRDGL